MAEEYKSLLGRPGSSFADIASAYITGNRKSDNRARNVLFASLLFNAKESRMQSNVLKQLKELEREKTFEQSNVTAKWNAYNKLMTEDEAYKNNPNHFRLKAEAEFNRVNPNFKLDTESQRKFRETEVSEYETAMLNLHNEKLKTGDVKKRLTKEQFFKPFEDYYVSEQERISAPKNVSLVHKAWDYVTGDRKQELTKTQRETAKNTATQASFEKLLKGDVFNGEEAIKLARDPNEFDFTQQEAILYINQNIKNDTIANDTIDMITKEDSDTKYTLNDLKGKLVSSNVNREINQIRKKIQGIGIQYDQAYKEIHKGNSALIDENGNIIQTDEYLQGRKDEIALKSGIGDEATIKFNRTLRNYENAIQKGDDKTAAFYRAQLQSFTIGVADRAILTSIMNIELDPIEGPKLLQKLEQDGRTIEQWRAKTYSSGQDIVDSALGI
tara:strand:- start:310 stop:1635 length:1326 start_codon:yes stop_codon:yes gene_type:complete